MNNDNSAICPIWGEPYSATASDRAGGTILINSDRTGGEYIIDAPAFINLTNLEDAHKVHLTTMLVDQRMHENVAPKVTVELIESAKNKPSLPVHERAERLLRYFARKSGNIGDDLDIGGDSDPLCQGSMAWSESTGWEEVLFLAQYLQERGWINGNIGDLLGAVGGIQVSVEGYSHISDLASERDSAQCFVAMWFGKEVNDLYHQGIKPAIEAAGYKAIRIDEKPHANKIDDEIIAEIRRSQFLVADFTHGDDGARGGVYYEAGFAHGLNLSVIFTCREDMVDKLHFDTRQYNHILWENENLDEFRKNLTNRIEALIGEGPNKGQTTT